jgi:hypothetical protein
MGMFDYVRCDAPLPDGFKPRGLFQTKDFDDPAMVTHIITAEGRLLLDNGHSEVVPLVERPMWNAEWGDSREAEEAHPWEAIAGCLRHIPKLEDANYHGVLNFYAGCDDKEWREYNAKFTDWQLVAIEVAPTDR